MTTPLTSSAASFLMHTSSFSPLRDSQLESSSPCHPLFAYTSGQKSLGSIGQNPWAERKARLTDAGQQQVDRSPNAQCLHELSHDRPVSSNSLVCTAPMKGSWQQAVAPSSHAHRAADAQSALAAQQNRAGSSRTHRSKATEDFPEQGNQPVIAQHSLASFFEAASSGRAGSKSGSAVVVAASCSTSTRKPSSSVNAAGCSASPFASCPTSQTASRASKPTDRLMSRPGSAVDAEETRIAAAAAAREASIAAEEQAASCHSASSLPMLTDYLARQSLSCEGTKQLSCSGPEEILSALNSTDLAFLAAAEPLQQESDLPRLEPLQHSTSSTVALDSQQFQTKLGCVSRSSCIHIPAHVDDDIDDDDDVVLHDSKLEAAVMSYSQPDGTDASFGKAVCQNGAECATAEDCSSLGFTSTVLGKQCWLGDTDTKALQQQDHASCLLNACGSLDSLYADNDWE